MDKEQNLEAWAGKLSVDPTDLNVLYSTNTGLKPGATKWVRASGSLIWIENRLVQEIGIYAQMRAIKRA